MKILVEVKDVNKKLKCLEEAEKHIKEAQRLLSWEIGSNLTLELKEPPEETDGSEI